LNLDDREPKRRYEVRECEISKRGLGLVGNEKDALEEPIREEIEDKGKQVIKGEDKEFRGFFSWGSLGT